MRTGSSPSSEALLWKRFAKLLAVALICVVGAWIALVSDRQNQSPRFESMRLFPALEGRLAEIAHIELTVGRGVRGVEKISLSRRPEGGFGVDQRGGYPANPRLAEKFLRGLAQLQAYEKRTSDEKQYARLGLVAPEKMGSALRVVLRDAQGKALAALLAGKVPEQVADVDGTGLIYARRDGEAQAYLARGSFPLAQNVADYLDPTFLSISPADIASVTLWAGTEHPVILTREKGAQDFVLQNVPQDRKPREAALLNNVAQALAMGSFADVAPEKAFEFPPAGLRVELVTYDGLIFSLSLAADAGFLWARVEVQGEGEPVVMRSKRFRGWIYRLPPALGSQLVQSMDLLTEPLDASH